jgi:sugar transferase EpsL
MDNRSPHPSRWYPRLKRVADMLAAAVGLVIAAPVMLMVAALVRLTMGKPVLFRHRRPGFQERLFTCLKFRTMKDAFDETGRSLPDDRRLTRVGTWLRRTSLDELPQLWNILRGDLSFIGPRPLIESYLPFYTETERRRHSVRPGLTGWAQVHGRNSLSFDERLRLDVWYVDNISCWLDLQILFKTVWIVFTQRGYAADLIALDQLRSSAVTSTASNQADSETTRMRN